jgi:hypothetical protein
VVAAGAVVQPPLGSREHPSSVRNLGAPAEVRLRPGCARDWLPPGASPVQPPLGSREAPQSIRNLPGALAAQPPIGSMPGPQSVRNLPNQSRNRLQGSHVVAPARKECSEGLWDGDAAARPGRATRVETMTRPRTTRRERSIGTPSKETTPATAGTAAGRLQVTQGVVQETGLFCASRRTEVWRFRPLFHKTGVSYAGEAGSA